MKKLFVLLMSFLAVTTVMTSCSDDDDNVPASQEVAGLYVGKASLGNTPTPVPGVSADETKIKLEQMGEKLKMTLVTSPLAEMFNETISLEGVNVSKDGSKFIISGSGTISVTGKGTPEGTPAMVVPIKLTGEGTPANMKLLIKADVQLVPAPAPATSFYVDFVGAIQYK